MLEAQIDGIAMFDRAEAVALRALGYLINSRSELNRFLSTSGLKASDLARQPACPEHLAAVLDYFIASEPLLLEFSRIVEVLPEAAYEARRMYGRGIRAWGGAAGQARLADDTLVRNRRRPAFSAGQGR